MIVYTLFSKHRIGVPRTNKDRQHKVKTNLCLLQPQFLLICFLLLLCIMENSVIRMYQCIWLVEPCILLTVVGLVSVADVTTF